MDKEAVQMFAAPIESSLKDAMEFGETSFVEHEQSPPNQRTDAAEHYAKLIDLSGRYGRFRHADSLPKPPRNCLESDPLDSPTLIATIKLKEVTASDLFRRLNSYSKQHALWSARAKPQAWRSMWRPYADAHARYARQNQGNTRQECRLLSDRKKSEDPNH